MSNRRSVRSINRCMLITIEDRCAWFPAGLIVAAFGWGDLDDRAIELAETAPMASA